jgi:hypothetical protein
MSSVSVSVSREFLGEMTKIVGSFGEVLIFDGEEEAITYFKGNDTLIFRSNEDAKEYVNNELDCIVYDNEADMAEHLEEAYSVGQIFSQEKVVEWVKQEYTIDEVFDTSDITDYARDNNQVGELFDEEEIIEWVQENISLEDIFGDEEIISAYKRTDRYAEKKKAKEMTTSRESIIKARDEALAELENVKTELCELKSSEAIGGETEEALRKENDELKAKIAKMERTVSTANQIRNLITSLVMPEPQEQERNPRDPVKRPGFDGFVWTWNADAGRGEWC